MVDEVGRDGLTALERVVARDEIRQLAYRYAYAVDHRDIDLLVSLFVPDVRVGGEHGQGALRAFWERTLAGVGVTVLHVGNHIIDFDDPEHARGVVYTIARLEHGGRWIEQAIRYDDTYERRDGRWLFARRRHSLWYGVEACERPLDQPPANWPEHQVGRGTVPYDTPTWANFWASHPQG